MICIFCKGLNIINENNSYICTDCGCINGYVLLSDNINFNDLIKRYKYKRLTYLTCLINNINLYYIKNNIEIMEIYKNHYDIIKFNYGENKKYMKKNKILNSNNYYYIYYFMFMKYKNEYEFIDNNLKIIIFSLFNKIEKIFNDNKKRIKILKKKIINYNFILSKIFIMINKPKFLSLLELPEKSIYEKLNKIWGDFFIL